MSSVRVQAFTCRPHVAARQSYTQIQALQVLWQADINHRKGRKLMAHLALASSIRGNYGSLEEIIFSIQKIVDCF
jgi:hypothetical protein